MLSLSATALIACATRTTLLTETGSSTDCHVPSKHSAILFMCPPNISPRRKFDSIKQRDARTHLHICNIVRLLLGLDEGLPVESRREWILRHEYPVPSMVAAGSGYFWSPRGMPGYISHKPYIAEDARLALASLGDHRLQACEKLRTGKGLSEKARNLRC